jgi:hypothetical protein
LADRVIAVESPGSMRPDQDERTSSFTSIFFKITSKR